MMPLVVGYLVQRDTKALATRALKTKAHFRNCNDLRQLPKMIGRLAVSAVVIELRPGRPSELAGVVRALRLRAIHVPIIAVVHGGNEEIRPLLALIRAGTTDVIITEDEDYWAVIRRHISVEDQAGTMVLEQLQAFVPEVAWPLIELRLTRFRRRLTRSKFWAEVAYEIQQEGGRTA